jgi:hypothetical protein
MIPEERKRLRLEVLKSVYESARGICDPTEFVVRQKRLLYELAECLLDDLNDQKDDE